MDILQDTPEHRPLPEDQQALGHIRGMISRLLGKRRHATGGAAPLAGGTPPIVPAVEIGTADALWKLATGAPARLAQATSATQEQRALQERQEIRLLLQAHLTEPTWDGLMSHVQAAAEHGELRFQLLRFPSDLCTDGGRKVRINEDGWQETLRGEAAEFAARWRRDLMPSGFGLQAATLEYSGGLPGDIGLFLTWYR